jgi:hypothetical protein
MRSDAGSRLGHRARGEAASTVGKKWGTQSRQSNGNGVFTARSFHSEGSAAGEPKLPKGVASTAEFA